MALTDPELDLLRELLEDDPADEVFLQVGEELVRRGQFGEAEAVLSGGLASNGHVVRGWELLARASLECANFDLAMAALRRLDTDPVTHPQNARLEILILERAGHLGDAAARIDAFLQVDPHDVVVCAARERLEAPPPETTRRASDPFLTVERAERYVAVGRSDRAVRVYRRILFHNPADHGVLARLRQLAAEERDWGQDDLSDELTDPGATPPDLAMPQPRLGMTPDRAMAREGLPASRPRPVVDADAETDPDEEDTDLHALPGGPGAARGPHKGRRRRRSLINR